MDNASNNDTAADCIYTALDKDWYRYRIRCVCHILTLAAKAGLYSKTTKASSKKIAQGLQVEHDQVIAENEEVDAVMKQLHAETWDEKAITEKQQASRLLGPPGKIRNIITYITASNQRREAFKEAQLLAKSDNEDTSFQFYTLLKECVTRWNGAYEMIKRGMLNSKYFISLISD